MTNEPLIFNPRDLAYVADPHPLYRRLRSEAPVYWWEPGHLWFLSHYADVEATFKDPRFTTDARTWRFYSPKLNELMPREVVEFFDHRMFYASPADHTRIRKVVASSFTPRAIAQREALVQQVVDELFAGIDARGGFDFVQAFASPMPVTVISRILDVPPEHAAAFRAWSDALIQVTYPMLPIEQHLELARRLPAGLALIRELIDRRRAEPGDDLLSSLVQAQEQGDRLSADELLALVGGLVTGGSETTMHLLAFAVLELSRHPEVTARVAADPQLLPGVIEETLRHEGFGSMGVARFALEDVEVHGQPIAKGDLVMCLTASAMRDERVYSDAERFDIDRDPTPNLSFGRGPHFCLGTHLARLTSRVALRALLERCPTLELDGPPVFRPHPFLRYMESLRLRPQPSGASS
jgi:cytochrome P450 enzyme